VSQNCKLKCRSPSRIAQKDQAEKIFGHINEIKKSITCKPSRLSTHIATRLYRSPEVIIYEKHYYKSLDIWSCGVIMAELFRYIVLYSEMDFNCSL
jgi:serine/threonine protein kinase